MGRLACCRGAASCLQLLAAWQAADPPPPEAYDELPPGYIIVAPGVVTVPFLCVEYDGPPSPHADAVYEVGLQVGEEVLIRTIGPFWVNTSGRAGATGNQFSSQQAGGACPGLGLPWCTACCSSNCIVTCTVLPVPASTAPASWGSCKCALYTESRLCAHACCRHHRASAPEGGGPGGVPRQAAPGG